MCRSDFCVCCVRMFVFERALLRVVQPTANNEAHSRIHNGPIYVVYNNACTMPSCICIVCECHCTDTIVCQQTNKQIHYTLAKDAIQNIAGGYNDTTHSHSFTIGVLWFFRLHTERNAHVVSPPWPTMNERTNVNEQPSTLMRLTRVYGIIMSMCRVEVRFCTKQ